MRDRILARETKDGGGAIFLAFAAHVIIDVGKLKSQESKGLIDCFDFIDTLHEIIIYFDRTLLGCWAFGKFELLLDYVAP